MNTQSEQEIRLRSSRASIRHSHSPSPLSSRGERKRSKSTGESSEGRFSDRYVGPFVQTLPSGLRDVLRSPIENTQRRASEAIDNLSTFIEVCRLRAYEWR